ncbi:Plasma membrane low glucose sensor [Exophiala xenobiotica]|nr:Plasma membrane low glucose sensor [Exophiala xenobiotica]KAK5215039.1 Plasma membrane low glucose sensor [Exophiala xenobiotica]KAK5221476.1 Plasma membrane low glucose sensor [Exophiala xenobiotica]KAK5245763.1 Plasma membrane low glucose sensor [Exophiala xenobiotica]KAK5261376.1 Plasma membrane low glucose sensor [Exophiala xenobiotica]
MTFVRRKDAPKLPGSKRPAILVGAFAAVGGILFGYDTASISGVVAMDAWIKTMATNTDANGDPVVTTGQISLVVSILSAGTFLGTLTMTPNIHLLIGGLVHCYRRHWVIGLVADGV